MAFSYWQTGNFGCGFRAPANQGPQGSVRDSGRQGYGYQNYAPGGYGREGWNKWAFSASCLIRSSTQTGSRLWIPSDLGSKLQTWLKGNDLTGAADAEISTWSDASGNGNNATGAATLARKPVLVLSGLNGMNVVSDRNTTDGNVSGYFTFPSGILAGRTQAAAFVVYKKNSSPAQFGPTLSDFGVDAASDHHPWSDNNYYIKYGRNARRTVTGAPTATNTWRILGFRGKTGDWRFDVNGTNYDTDASNTFAVNTSTSPMLFYASAAGHLLDGQIAEIVDCNDFLTTAEKEQVEGYLAWKWGLQANLPAGHTYASAAPTVGTPSVVTGVASPSLTAFTSTATAAVKVKAAASAALNAFTTTSAAKALVKATANPSIGTFLSAAAAKALTHGLGSGALNAFTSASVAKVKVKATASVAPSSFTGSSAAKVKVKAAASPSPSNFTSSATAASKVNATASPTLGSFTSGAAAHILVHGAGSGILSAFGSTSVAKVRVKASASPSLNPFTLSAAADVVSANINAAASITLSPFVSAAAARALVEGLGGGTLNAFTSAAIAKAKVRASGSPALDAFTGTAQAAVRIKAAATVNYGPFTLTAALGSPQDYPPGAVNRLRVGLIGEGVRRVAAASGGRGQLVGSATRIGRAAVGGRVGTVVGR